MSEAAASPDAPKKKSRKGLIIAIASVVLLGAGGAGAWFFLNKGEPDPEAAAQASADKKKAARVFVTLEPFIVNLADRESERYAQVGVVLEVENKETEAQMTAKMPAVRNEILLLISSKLANELITRDGKVQLADEIAVAAARPLGWEPADEEEPEEEPAKAKGKDAGKAKSAKRKRVEPPPNPVAHVHFASFIVQ